MSQSAADEPDPIPRWTRTVRAKLRSRWPGKAGLRLRVSFGFVFLALLGTCTGPRPAPGVAILLLGMMLIHELPLALWARALGRFVRISIHSSGGETEIGGDPVPLRRRFFLALAGSVASMATGAALLWWASAVQSPLLCEAGRLQLFWGAVQLLPLSPFKLGTLLREQVRQWARVKQACASLGLAFVVLVKSVSALAAPLILVAFGVWLYACCYELVRSIARAQDTRLAAEQRLGKIQAFILADDPQRALRLARHLLRSAKSAELRTRVGEALAWAAIGAGDVKAAREALSELPESSLDSHLLASYLATSGRPADAIALLEYAASRGWRSSESLRLLADLYYRVNDREALSRLARSAADVLGADELAKIERALATPPSKPPEAPPESLAATRLRHAFGE
ncbi:MAG TPA: hypothetical protein VNG33_02665 [Polyangiaceae bacterium]|nr:hypothetical protein [Polyangiaceae bacterium]